MMTQREERVMELHDRGFRNGEIALLLDIKPSEVLDIVGKIDDESGDFSAMVVKGSRKLSASIRSNHPSRFCPNVKVALTEEEATVRAMRIRDASVSHIARCLNVPRSTVYSILKRLPDVEIERMAYLKAARRPMKYNLVLERHLVRKA